MSQSSSETSGCLGCLGILFFVVFVVPSLISGLFAVVQGKATFSLSKCSFKLGSSVSFSCDPQITAKYQFLNVTDLETKKSAIRASMRQLHSRVDKGQCQTIYEQASELLQRDNKQADFLQYCDSLRQTIGTTKSFEPVSWEWLPTDEQSNEYVRVYAKVNAKNLSINEMSIWQIKGKKPTLAAHVYEPITVQPNDRSAN